MNWGRTARELAGTGRNVAWYRRWSSTSLEAKKADLLTAIGRLDLNRTHCPAGQMRHTQRGLQWHIHHQLVLCCVGVCRLAPQQGLDGHALVGACQHEVRPLARFGRGGREVAHLRAVTGRHVPLRPLNALNKLPHFGARVAAGFPIGKQWRPVGHRRQRRQPVDGGSWRRHRGWFL